MQASRSIFNDLSARVRGEVLISDFDRGRYATDASAYQIMPLAVVVPKAESDLSETLAYASLQGIPVLPRGGGTSQCGQTVNRAIVIDFSKWLNRLVDLNVESMLCKVQGGMVLDSLNRRLKPYGVWFPVDVSTASRATIGGMAGNNSCGSRSIRYGLMRDNVKSIDALLASGDQLRFAELDPASNMVPALFQDLLKIAAREESEIASRFPKVARRVGGYNLDAVVPSQNPVNMSHLLVGAEGTLAISNTIELKLSPLPANKVLGICHFPSFYEAMDSAQHIVKLGPVAVELIDRTMIELSRTIMLYRDTIERMVEGEPEALLLVEFAEDDQSENLRRLAALQELMSDLGFDFSNPCGRRGGIVEAVAPEFQTSVFEVRKAGLNIMMSMREDRKPVSFVEDCAVALEDLAEYTARLTDIFHKHGTSGTWYAHASVGCLHVRPILNLRMEKDIRAMRGIAEECFEIVREYKGSHSGEHGDGICRSEFHEKMFGRRLVKSFGQVKDLFDPAGMMNPGKIVNAPKMDDASLFRYSPDYAVEPFETVLNWSGWTGAGGGFQGAVEMCNNNGACRKLSGGVMCPSYRVTRDERHVTRGRANVLRLAISGQLGRDAITSNSMRDAMHLCIGCKACRRECPTGVDMARMKIEIDSARYRAFGAKFSDKLIANLPRYARYASGVSPLSNMFSASSTLRLLFEPLTGLGRHRPLPKWSRKPYLNELPAGPQAGKRVVLFADTFSAWFDPGSLHAAKDVLAAAGFHVISAMGESKRRPLCCGRTYLSAGMAEQARIEVERTLKALKPYLEQDIPVVGVEPSCILGLRDEVPALMCSPLAEKLAQTSYLFEEFLCTEGVELDLKPFNGRAVLHGHCHQKSFGQVEYVHESLQQIPGLDFSVIGSGCCGMAGAFGYGRDTSDISVKMAELDLVPAIEAAGDDVTTIADGFSCRHQIALTTGRDAIHVAKLMQGLL